MTYKKITLPDNLSEMTYDYIKSVIDYLKKNDKLNAIDNGTLHLLATSYDQYLKANELIAKEGLVIAGAKNSIIPHPAVRIAKDAKSMALNIMTNMALTLKARTKLDGMVEAEETPLEKFFAD